MKPAYLITQLSSGFALALTPVWAQSVAAPTDAAPIQLSVFEVTADKDLGYAASTTMSGTRTNEKLENLPNAISVMSADFLADLGLLNFLDAADFGVGTENIYNDNGTRGAAVGTRSGNQISFRGLSSARQLRDGFPWYMPEDAFNIERIEFSRGPGGLSYGDVDAGGTVNVSTKRATFGRTSTTLATRWDSFGGRRAALDYQQTLLPRRFAFRVNGVYNDGEGARQRSGSDLKGGAAALRWQLAPRTVIDVSFERANQRDGQTHSILTDQTAAYVRGTGTNDLDAIPALAGVQTDGVGQFRTQAAGNKQIWTLLDGGIYNLESTATAVFRNSRVQTGAAVANLVTNPALVPGGSIPESIVPRYQDWAGPDNYADQRWHAYTVELRHDFTDRLRVLIAHNAQRDTVLVRKSLNDNLQTTFGGRGLFIDVTPNLPDPTDPAGLRGEGYDFGVRINFLAGRVTTSYVHFETTSTNDGFGIGTVPRTELNPLLATPFFNNTDYRDNRSTGDEVELFFSPTPNWTGRLSYSSSSVIFTNFYPLLKVKLAEAQATATARGLDPLAATAQTLQTMADTIDGVTATGRHTGNATVRYLFTEGALKGLALGGTGRYAQGRARSAVNIGGNIALPATTTKDDWEFGTFASYRHKIGRVQWTCQLNVKNILDRVTLQGNRLYARYTPNPRQFILSNSFGF
ncbi:MAG: TonB-dependent receptor plug domain-containing protein [Opitutaceae bacterium]|nr:TonB-dependent receptor plug domain-containing protein [Opitutaceae bacterium]